MKNEKKRSTRLGLAISVLLLVPQVALASFLDVSEDHPYFNAIQNLEDKKIIQGYGNNMFRPDHPITKAEFFKIAFQHAGYKPDLNLNYITSFTDVPEESWFSPYVKQALDLNLIKIVPEYPEFRPEQPMSRIEALKLILPLEGVPAPLNDATTPLIFEDVPANSLISHYVKAAQKAKIFIPSEEPYFFPYKILTRAEAAELLYRAEIYRQNSGTSFEIPFEDSFGSNLVDNSKFPILLNVWAKLNTESLYKDDINPDNLIYGAISGMVESVNDEQAVFQDPESARQLQESLTGNYEGIGTIIDIFEDQFLIVTVLENAPAAEAGIQAGDVILEIDGHDVSDYSIEDLLNAIKGPSGTSLTMKISRDGQEKTFTITREEIALDTVFFPAAIDVPEDIGYIAVYQFTETTALDFENLLQETLKNNPHGLIIDLRDNPGGYVDAAFEILDIFVPEGEVMISLNLSGEKIYTESLGTGNLPDDLPIVVLVNENTASAAEIVAGALQVHDIATIIGVQTFGKGTVQEVNFYNDGSIFKFTIAEWFTPDNQSIDKKGLTPDIIVQETKSDTLGETDSQLKRAIEEIQKQ